MVVLYNVFVALRAALRVNAHVKGRGPNRCVSLAEGSTASVLAIDRFEIPGSNVVFVSDEVCGSSWGREVA